MWGAVAGERHSLWTLRQARAWTDRTTTKPRSRARADGRHFVDGILSTARGWRNSHTRRCAGRLRPRIPQWSAAGSLVLAASAAHRRRMVAAGKIRRRFLRGLGVAAARRVGADRCPRNGFHRAVECSTWYRTGHLYTLGAATGAIGRRVQSIGAGRVKGHRSFASAGLLALCPPAA